MAANARDSQKAHFNRKNRLASYEWRAPAQATS
jgi:hypothetical protein